MHRSAEICATERTVEIFINNKRVTSHVRSRQKNSHTTVHEHRPRSHQEYAQWTPERLVEWAQKLGPHTATVVHEIMQRRQHPEQGFRSVLGLLRLREKYADSRIEQACTRAVRYGTFSRKSILSILRNNLDQQQDNCGSEREQMSLPTHDNIRGPDYYR